MVYSHSVPSSAVESVKRKRGRPRKYTTPDQAAAAKRLSAPAKRDATVASSSASSSYSSKKSHLGNVGQGFSPHIITVAAGEDVGQKIMMFMQQSKREICVISASGSVSNASLCQPATSGGSITYEGRFDILSLSGSYIRTELGGRTGGLSVCLSSFDGQIIGGGLGNVIIGTFVIDAKKDVKGDAASGKLPSPRGGQSVSGLNFVGSPHQMGGGSPFMIQQRSMQLTTPPHSMEWRSNAGHGMHQSLENADYEPIPD
ncbi:hypothetical protein BUALT_Bualt06G0041000 [Buddleja alternifolia]|uniref:AT-hook motif nuclear-localized protein n=1 Tax=Buddleja alternifolia TaxID=168488 RepID=A0AAV6XNG0_9LAMI|nr:hypothetical protein BUALT_Bualt06G0041000 [Buddleja alternifolia]